MNWHALRSYFIHNRNERNGTLLLLILIVLLLAATHFIKSWMQPQALPVSALEEALAGVQNSGALPELPPASPLVESAKFPFDPNTASDSALRALGLTDSELATFRKYQSKGGAFTYKSDLARLYFIDSAEYQALEAYINLPERGAYERPHEVPSGHYSHVVDTLEWSDTAAYSDYRYEPLQVNINTADTTELKALPGIGSFYAKAIVKYREELGGYHHLAQLLEIWKMTPEKIDGFADRVVINPATVRTIAVNSCTAQELSAHPYVDFGAASKIVLARERDGPFTSLEEVCRAGLLRKEICGKLAPYLDLSPP